MKVKQFLVLPKLPEQIGTLQNMSQNLWYSWNWELVRLFIRLNPEVWEECYQNPVKMLSKLPQETLEKAANDEGFQASLKRVYDRFNSYQSSKKWFEKTYEQYKDNKVAYFSLEYGLDTGLPVYSGGLGVLSGDTLKAASDLGLPMVAVGLLYRYGYFRQFLSADGWQQEKYEENDWYHMPVQPVKDENDQPLKITVELDGAPVYVQVWKVQVGIIPLYLLDTNIPENATKYREITSVLYGGDKDMRIRQEIVLGIGGVRALKAMNIDPSIFHMNEGHSWFLTLERIRELMHEKNLSFEEASQYIWSTTVFTTHTPVPAGNEKFEPVLIHRYLGKYIEQLGISWVDFVNIGRVFANDESEPFCMTVAALHYAAFANGVSQLHGEISRNMWHNVWPGVPKDEVPIKAITNGVHTLSWISHDMHELYESYLGADYQNKPEKLEIWENANKIPDAELWRIHNRRRERLVFFARKRLKQQLVRQGASQFDIRKADQMLDPQVLTIGFARRFSTYKRGNLIFSDPERLAKIVNNSDMPVQIIIAGKAHPLDNPGKEIIKEIIQHTQDPQFADRIIFIEDYDINVARYLVQGADIWLNNPRRPQEASGTSGMKAALNGVLNLSVLDGWWIEGFSKDNGFKIGNGEEYDNVELQDHLESDMLYNSLEKEVIPMFYKRSEIGLPSKWIAKMRSAINMAGQHFSSHRMLIDYTEQFYIPGLEASNNMRKDEMNLTKEVTAWVSRMKQNWDRIKISNVDIPDISGDLYVGQKFPIKIDVELGEIKPEDINVEIISGILDSMDQIKDYQPSQAAVLQPNGNSVYTFKGEVICNQSGRFGITARITPKNDALPHTIKPKLISWW